MKFSEAPSKIALAIPNPPRCMSRLLIVAIFDVSPSERNLVSATDSLIPIPLSAHDKVRVSASHVTSNRPSLICASIPAPTASAIASQLFWSASRVATTGTST